MTKWQYLLESTDQRIQALLSRVKANPGDERALAQLYHTAKRAGKSVYITILPQRIRGVNSGLAGLWKIIDVKESVPEGQFVPIIPRGVSVDDEEDDHFPDGDDDKMGFHLRKVSGGSIVTRRGYRAWFIADELSALRVIVGVK